MIGNLIDGREIHDLYLDPKQKCSYLHKSFTQSQVK